MPLQHTVNIFLVKRQVGFLRKKSKENENERTTEDRRRQAKGSQQTTLVKESSDVIHLTPQLNRNMMLRSAARNMISRQSRCVRSTRSISCMNKDLSITAKKAGINGGPVNAYFCSSQQSIRFRDVSIRSFSSDTEDKEVNKESLEFKAETRQLLDIVTNSLYTEKEIFLRELISNASDALEKLRHMQSIAQEVDCQDPEVPPEIRIETDEVNGTISISDTGIGMNRKEMIDHLGTIASSGSKAFISELALKHEDGGDGLDASRGIIGKFGVGFYSAFMVGDKVEFRSKPAFIKDQAVPLIWSSDGIGSYDISPLSDEIRQNRGSTLVIHLKDDQLEYADEKRVEAVLKKYSNFVNFPIYLNGTRLNTINAIWADDPKTVTDEEYSEFYKYIANAFDEPLERLHYRADAPLDIKALFFIPSFHSEKVSGIAYISV